MILAVDDIVEQLPRAWGAPVITAILRGQPEDFIVEEQLKFTPTGSGEHVLFLVEKRGANTQWVARQLARQLGVKPHTVTYAGMKDRHAVTRQWFGAAGLRDDISTQTYGEAGSDGEYWRVLQTVRHSKKLRHGAVALNRFDINLRNVVGDPQALQQRLRLIEQSGVPNYFGEQRFGHSNLADADRWARADGPSPDRHVRGIWLSALRAALFNGVLAERVVQGIWNKLVEGDLAVLAGTRSFFAIDGVDDELTRRLGEFDISPSGPLFGSGALAVAGRPLDIEQNVATNNALWVEHLQRMGLTQERRALVLNAGAIECGWHENNAQVRLQFSLPTGCFATTVLREIGHWDHV